MAIDFPSSPTNGQTFTSGSLVYTYDGTKWTAAPAGVSGGTKIEVGNTKAEVTDTGSNGTFAVTTEGTQRLAVDSSGRLLVGTSTARSMGGITAGLFIEGTSYNSLSLNNNTNDAFSSLIAFGKSRGTVTGSLTSVNSGDRLGAISFYGADGSSNVQAALISVEVDGTPGANDMPGRLVFSTTPDSGSSPVERMRILSGGSTRTFASENCMVVSDATSAGTVSWIFQGKHSATAVNTGTTSINIFSNGNITNTNNSYGAISDIKLKENIVDASSQWDDLKALQVRKYNFKEGQTHTQIGLIAQEVELVSPGLVTESPDRDEEGNDLGTVTKSVNYSVLYMKAVKALQEAMQRIETLEAKVATLESQQPQ